MLAFIEYSSDNTRKLKVDDLSLTEEEFTHYTKLDMRNILALKVGSGTKGWKVVKLTGYRKADRLIIPEYENLTDMVSKRDAKAFISRMWNV